MKKLSFFLMAMLFSVMSFAAEAKFDWSGITTTQSPTVANVYTQGDVTLTFEKASGSNIPAENKEGSIRMYKGTTLRIVVAGENNVITNVAFTCTSASYAATNLQYNGEALPSNEWALTTPAADILLNAVANARFKSIVVTYGQVAADYIAAPAISGDVDFIESTEVSIAAGEGLKVYYTVDGNDPTNASAEYTAPFEVTATTTVKAIAYNGENASEVASQTFTKATEVTCAEAKEIALAVSGNNVPTELTYVVKGYVTKTVNSWSSGKQSFWIADTKDGGNVFQAYYCFVSQAVQVGNYVQLFGKLTKYNTTPEMADGQATILPDPAPEPVMFNVTVTAENGTVEGAGEYAENAEATLTATPAEGYEFVNWTVDGAEVSTENPYTFVVTANVALVANFQEVVEDPNKVPTNAELWEAFKPYYNTYYGLARADQPIDKVSTFANAKMQEIMTDAASEYKWLGDYVLGVAAGQGVTLPTDMAAANEGAWRWAVHAFFNATTGANGAAGTDFTEAGKPENWGPYYLAAQKPAEPATETVYFINAKKWAKVNVYAWTTDPNASWPGAAATKEAEQIAGYDVYSFTANAGQYANVIFNDGSSQTPDLVWTAGKYYVIDMGWLTKEEAETKLAAPLPETWNIVGDAGLMGKGWDLNAAENAMTLQADGTYLLEKKDITLTAGSYEYKAAKDHGWTVAVPQDGNQTLKITTSGIYDVTFVLDVTAKKLTATATLKQAAVVIPTVVIAGDMNSWDQTKDKFTMAADSLTATFKATLAVKNYGFKMIVGGAWLSDGKTITRAANSHKFTGANGGNSTLKADIAGEYLFTWEYATKTLTVTYPALPVKYNVTVTAENGTVTGAGEYEEGKTATLTATAAEGYEFVNWTVGEEVVSTENPYSFVVTADVALVANFKEVEPAIEWIEMPLEITNLTTMEMPVEGVTYLQLTGRDDMNDADVMLFLNNYTGEEKAYEVNAESSFMTFGGLELTVMDGSITKSVDPELGDVYAGIVHASVEEDGVAMYVEFTLKMYALPAIAIELEDVEITVNEESAIAFFNATWEGAPLQVEVSGFEEVEFKEYPECWLSIGDDVNWVDAAAGPAAVIIEDGVAMLEGEFTSFSSGKTYEVMLSGKLPVKEEPVVEPTYTENNLNTYAFGLESELTEETLNVTYRLNNSNATSVNVLVYNGENVVATVAGGTSIGKNVVEIATADLPQGRMLTWSVEVNGTSVAAPTQEAKIYSFYHPSGLDIDNNPENPTFGMLLINEGMHSVKDKTEGYVSAQFGAGIFAFTPSLDLIPNGELPGYNGGIEFTTGRADGAGTAYSPRRIRISEDGRIFVTSLNTDGNYLWEVNPANMNEWTPVFQGTLNENKELITADSAFIAAPNNGFDVKGAGENLQLAMYSVNLPGITSAAMSGFRLHEYNLGTATTWATAPSKTIVEGKYAINYTGTQVVYDNEGGVWIASYRGTANDANPGLVHINADGVEDAKLIWSNVRQAGIRFNNDFTKLVVAGNNGAAKKATIYAVSKDANGAPVLTEETVIDMASVGNNLNDFAFDYAGNLYACGNSAEKLIGWAMPYSGQVVTPAASKYAFTVGSAVEPVEMVGVVKRALQYYDATIVLTHEADGTAHIYNVVDGVVAEVSQEGVIARDPENAGDYLAISDIALTEDGKLVAINYMQTQSGDDYVNAGLKRGETRVYIWNDLHDAPSILFTSKMSSNWFRSKQGLTMAVKGTSDNMEIFTTGIHATSAWARVSSYRVINGVYEEPAVNHNDHYFFYDVADAVALETTVGTQYELTASPLGAMNWILDAELINPVEIVESESNNVEISSCVALTQDLGKKYQGVSVVTVGEQVLMVAPYATAEGLLAGVKVLDITAGLDAATEVATADLDAAVEATAAATAVAVAENTLTITLVADATIYTLNVELESEPNYMVIEDNITNLVIDLESMAIIGGPSTMWQVEVFLGLAEDDNMDGQWSLSPESSVAIMGFDARFIDGYVYDIDLNAPAAKAVLHVEDSGFLYEIKLNMTNTPQESIVVVVEDATVQIDTIPLFGDQVDYALKMTADWTYAEDGVTYPVLVEVPVYYPEATEPSEMTCTVTIGGQGVDDPWLGFGEGTLTITTVDGVVTAKGIVANPYTGVAFDVTVSGKLPVVEPEATWTVAGPASIFGTEWDPSNTANDMVKQEDGTYKWEKTDLTLAASNIQFKVAKNHAWDEAYPSANYDLAIAEAGIYTITITFNAETKEVVGTATKTGDAVVIPTIAIAGDMNGWNTTDNKFVKSEDELTATLTLNLEAKDYGFKILVAGGWTSDGATVTRENNTVVFTGANGENSTLVADVAGDYTFTWTYATSTLVVTYPVASSVDNVQVNATAVKVIKNGQLIIIKNGKEYNVQGAQL